jgi:DNA-binding Lrp family transcriptional regulator
MIELSALEIELIRQLQEEFPVCSDPYAVIASRIGVTEDDVLRMINTFHDKGYLRRIGALLYQSSVGYSINAMLVWDADEKLLREKKDELVSIPNITHCYIRNRDIDFDYNFYTMVHVHDEDELSSLVEQIASMIVPRKYGVLRTVKELKKIKMKYFMEKKL